NTVIVIEHNLDVIKTADWVVDMGPEGGDGGGGVVVEGTPETVADCAASHTGRYLRRVLADRAPAAAPPATRAPKAKPQASKAPATARGRPGRSSAGS